MSAASGAIFTADELARLRADTPACARFAHFAHGSASLPPAPVFDALQRWLAAEQAQGTHRASLLLEEELAQVRPGVARLIGAAAHQIAFVDSASRAWALALDAAIDGCKHPVVITTAHEWGANAINLLAAERRARLRLAHLDRDEDAPLIDRVHAALRGVAAYETPILSLPLVPNAYGVRLSLEGVAEAIHAHRGLLFVDACHAVGQFPVDVGAIKSDVLVFPGRKWLRGPKGIAVLQVSDRALALLGAPAFMDIAGAQWTGSRTVTMHADARRFEGFEYHPGLRLALGAACTYAAGVGLERIASRNRELRQLIATRLAQHFGLQPLEQAHPRATALMTYRLASVDDTAAIRVLRDAGVNASVIGPQYARWALEARGAVALLRLTPHYISNDTDIERLARALVQLFQRAA